LITDEECWEIFKYSLKLAANALGPLWQAIQMANVNRGVNHKGLKLKPALSQVTLAKTVVIE